jgi:hypothetical protein
MGTFGNTVQEPTAVKWDSWWGWQYDATVGGTINSITAFWGAAGDYHIGIYDDDGLDYPENLLVETGAWTRPAAGWQTKVVADTAFSVGKVWIIAGQDIGINTAEIVGHLNTQDQALRGFRLAAAYGAMPNPMTHGGGVNAHDCSVYFTYTAGGLAQIASRRLLVDCGRAIKTIGFNPKGLRFPNLKPRVIS